MAQKEALSLQRGDADTPQRYLSRHFSWRCAGGRRYKDPRWGVETVKSQVRAEMESLAHLERTSEITGLERWLCYFANVFHSQNVSNCKLKELLIIKFKRWNMNMRRVRVLLSLHLHRPTPASWQHSKSPMLPVHAPFCTS